MLPLFLTAASVDRTTGTRQVALRLLANMAVQQGTTKRRSAISAPKRVANSSWHWACWQWWLRALGNSAAQAQHSTITAQLRFTRNDTISACGQSDTRQLAGPADRDG